MRVNFMCRATGRFYENFPVDGDMEYHPNHYPEDEIVMLSDRAIDVETGEILHLYQVKIANYTSNRIIRPSAVD